MKDVLHASTTPQTLKNCIKKKPLKETLKKKSNIQFCNSNYPIDIFLVKPCTTEVKIK